MLSIPEKFVHTIEGAFEGGHAWLNRLLTLLDECAERWSLILEPPFALSYNYVAPAVRADGTRVVLKAGVPRHELGTEIDALCLFDGRGGVQLLDFDKGQGVLLLERLEPGTSLATLVEAEDEKATALAAGVMRQLWRPAPREHEFPTVAQWAAGLKRMRETFGGNTGPLPTRLVEEAETLFDELLSSMAEPVVLHGDLHHDNLLMGRGGWLAIDPKGVLGEPAYEVGALLRNPLPQLLELPEPNRVLSRRIDQFAEALDCDRARIRGWGLAQAILSVCWSLEDNSKGWQSSLAVAEILASLPD